MFFDRSLNSLLYLREVVFEKCHMFITVYNDILENKIGKKMWRKIILKFFQFSVYINFVVKVLNQSVITLGQSK